MQLRQEIVIFGYLTLLYVISNDLSHDQISYSLTHHMIRINITIKIPRNPHCSHLCINLKNTSGFRLTDLTLEYKIITSCFRKFPNSINHRISIFIECKSIIVMPTLSKYPLLLVQQYDHRLLQRCW